MTNFTDTLLTIAVSIIPMFLLALFGTATYELYLVEGFSANVVIVGGFLSFIALSFITVAIIDMKYNR